MIFIILCIIALLTLGTGIYFFLPTFAYGYFGLPFLLVVVLLLLFSVSRAVEGNAPQKKFSGFILLITFFVISYLTIVSFVSTAPIIHADDYQVLLGKVKEGDNFAKQISPISVEEIRTVDQAVAERLGDKILGAKPALGSQVDLGEFTIQQFQGKLYWVAPLLHSGFFKWLDNRQGTPGYVMVSATNERDVRLVQEIDGRPLNIRYQPNAFFGDNLKRHLFFNGYASKGYTDYTFEIDEKGCPHWVITQYEKKVGFSGKEAIGTIIVNPETGAQQAYTITETPEWVDRIQPYDFVKEQLSDWGEFVQGYWNFSNENKLKPTEGMSLVFGADGKSYWYTGLTSVGADQGTVGFMLIDTRSKDATWFQQIGATETAAMSSAAGKVQEKGYGVTFPVTYNINGIPTYVMSLKDRGGLVKMIGMVSVEDYTIVGVGNNIKECLRAYKNAVNSKGHLNIPSENKNTLQLEAKVLRVGSDVRNGNMNFYLVLTGAEDRIFIGNTMISNELPVTQKGDFVKVTYDDDLSQLVDLVDFNNLDIKPRNEVQTVEN
ncbi:hypothetical protein [Persicobacter diffluens]|uniref:Cell shape-determining protein n=1 Tax=Persicobacter diffluens TaxID=981 RepID=A0AAN4VY47_9BACT|nr:hypothetical protein PEDI_10520 [Persicobacter diffluens]